jgi:two-component system nitrogen regulation response regulator GlnG
VRELENAVKRALVLSTGDVLTPDDFAFLDDAAQPDAARASLSALIEEEARVALEAGETDVYRSILTRVERPLLEVVLGQTDGNQIRAAALLGMNRNTLRKKIVDLGIRLPGRE